MKIELIVGQLQHHGEIKTFIATFDFNHFIRIPMVVPMHCILVGLNCMEWFVGIENNLLCRFSCTILRYVCFIKNIPNRIALVF